MNHARSFVVFFFGALLLAGCMAPTWKLKTRAAFDLSCPKEQIEVTPLEGNAYGVTACGQKATYVWIPVNTRTGAGGEWVMNSTSNSAGRSSRAE